jgi:chemotaxis protein CheZ
MVDPAARALPVLEDELRRRLQDIRARHSAVDAPVVAEVVRAVLTTMTGELTAQESSLLAEVAALGDMITEARQEIASLDVGDITESHIPVATDELDAVLEHTALATDRILEVCEMLDTMADRLTEAADADALRQATTTIYEACGFQDITGQRISKVINALKAIDSKVAHMLAAFSSPSHRRMATAAAAGRAAATAADDPVLMRGPQMPAMAMEQSDIDRLLASFE